MTGRPRSLMECGRALLNGRGGERSSDCEGRRAGAVRLDGPAGNAPRSGAAPMRAAVGVEPLRQGGSVGRDERHGLRGEPAERTLIAAMARARAWPARPGRRYARRGRRVAENRLEVGGDRAPSWAAAKAGAASAGWAATAKSWTRSESATMSAVSGERSDLIPPPVRRARRLVLRPPPRNANIPQALRRNHSGAGLG